MAKHEDEFKQEYEFYEKYKDIFTPKYSNYTRKKAENIARKLNAEFPNYKSVRFTASHGGTEEDKAAYQEMFFEYMAYNSYLYEKYDLDYGLSIPGYSPESSMAYNYTVYELLENGKSIEEATASARDVAMTFGGGEASGFQMMVMMGYPNDMEQARATPESEKEPDYATQIDLRDKGIDHNFSYTNYELIFGTDKSGIKERIAYEFDLYEYLIKNEKLVDSKIEELAERSADWFEWKNENINYGESLKQQFRNRYEEVKLAQQIVEKYGDNIFKAERTNSTVSTEEILNTKQRLSFSQTNAEISA